MNIASTEIKTDIDCGVEKETIQSIRNNVSMIYREMEDFIISITRRMHEFRSVITPYVNYFYTPEGATIGESFVSDVVTPSRCELDHAIDRAVKIMAGDESMNKNVARAIEEVLGLKKSIDRILWFIDEIDIYAENTMIISTKYGDEGRSLTRISNEMSSMAQLVNGIGVNFREYLEMLDVSRAEFNEIRKRIEVISENYLTRMKIDLSVAFTEMAGELAAVSSQVNGMLSSSDGVEVSMKNFVNNIQMEDVIRQKVEKILFYMGEMGNGGGKDLDAVMMQVILTRLSDLEKDLSGQYDEVDSTCKKISEFLNVTLSRFYASDESEADGKQNRMSIIYNKIEGLKNEYIRYMEEIISDKKKLLGMCELIISVLEEFDELFSCICDKVKRFEALNIITRIELARHVKLSRTIGRALSSVMRLPAQMKLIVSDSVALYREIRKNIEATIDQYKENFRLQEEVLAGCIKSMKRVSIKLDESQKYYRDISREIGHSSGCVLEFIDVGCRKNALYEARETVRDIIAGFNARRESVFGDHEPDVANLMLRLKHDAELEHAGDLLAALLSEFEADKTKNHVIIF